MIDAYLLELERQLASAGIRGRDAGRILAEAREHLRDAAASVGEESAVLAFGPADVLARQTAAERATVLGRRSAHAAFGALSAVGIWVVASVALVRNPPDVLGGRVPGVGLLSTMLVVVAAQVAFVSGSLALVRAIRLRAVVAAPAAELALLRRRSAIALAAGAVALAGRALYGIDFQRELAGWWTWGAVAASLALAIPLAAGSRAVHRASRPVAAPGGEAGDVFDDLRPILSLPPLRHLGLDGHPGRLALACATAVGAAVLLAGWLAEGDPGSGIVRVGFEVSALLGCWALLRRPLGLGDGRPA